MQKEAFWLKTPCITLRETTEWPETVKLGANHLVGANTQKIVQEATKILEKREETIGKFKEKLNPFGDGKASQKILDTIKMFTNILLNTKH